MIRSAPLRAHLPPCLSHSSAICSMVRLKAMSRFLALRWNREYSSCGIGPTPRQRPFRAPRLMILLVEVARAIADRGASEVSRSQANRVRDVVVFHLQVQAVRLVG